MMIPLQIYILFHNTQSSGHETVCGQTVSELIDLLGLPDFLDGIVATARGFVCSALSARLQVRDVAEPAALQGYFDTLRQIILKLKELGELSNLARFLSVGQLLVKLVNFNSKFYPYRLDIIDPENSKYSVLDIFISKQLVKSYDRKKTFRT